LIESGPPMDLTEREARVAAGVDRARRGALSLSWLFLLAIAVLSLGKCKWEWDLLAYSACALELRGADLDEVHSLVYDDLVREAPADDAEKLMHKGDYRERMTSDAQAFAAQLPFYRGRVTYVAAIAAVSSLGLALSSSVFLVSWLGGCALLLACGWWLRRSDSLERGGTLGRLLLLVALGFFPGFKTAATPDSLAAALLMWGALLLFETRKNWIAVLLFALCVGTRVDSLILIAPLLLWNGLGSRCENRLRPAQLGFALALCGSVALACTIGRGTYGPWVVFHHTFLGYAAHPELETPALDLATWASQVLRRLPEFGRFAPLLFTLVGLLTLRMGWRRGGLRDPGAGLALAVLLATAAHFALFPALRPRLMLPYWALTALALTRVGRGPAQPRSAQASP
jgi:hypothetical protein